MVLQYVYNVPFIGIVTFDHVTLDSHISCSSPDL